MNLADAWPGIEAHPAPLEDLPKPRWQMDWSTHPLSARRLYNLVRFLKPRVIIETGTFEGLGTYTLAKAAHANGTGAKIFTIDYDGDPESSIPGGQWAALKTYRAENLARARAAFPGVGISFVEGDSRQVLPEVLREGGAPWDLFFQDSMHFTAGIAAEWNLMKPHAAPGAVAIFDDVCLDWKKLPAHLLGSSRDFCLGFALSDGLRGGWKWRSTAKGRSQFFAWKR